MFMRIGIGLAGFIFVSALAGTVFGDDAEVPATNQTDEKGFVSLFNGKDLTGWEGDDSLWTVQNGMIVGNSPGIKKNQFLATKKSFSDFELRLEFRMHDGKGNSGVQFRSKRVPNDTAVEGYQADLGEGWWGSLYDEHRRRRILAKAPPELADVLRNDGWNEYIIRAKGDKITLAINGFQTVNYTEPNDKIAREGIIALQIHSGPAMRMDFKNIRIKPLSD